MRASLALVLLVGCGKPRDHERDAMPMTQERRIPPLDAAAPAKVETATFALG
ncbi:MAG: hypothetical protein HYY17_00275 [Planctomycetes bacterium]|nr:hypothetical protein [Planctomycetota bacterium]